MTDPQSDNAIWQGMSCSAALVGRFFDCARQAAGEEATAIVLVGERIYWVDRPHHHPDLPPAMSIHWLRDEEGRMVGELVHSIMGGPLTKQTHVEITKMNLMGKSEVTRAKLLQ